MRQPSGGFNNTSLSQVFSHTVARYAATTSAPSSLMSSAVANPLSTLSSTPSSSSSSQSHSAVGPAVGGAVGGVAVLGIVATAIYFCLRRRRRRQSLSGHLFGRSELSAQGPIRLEQEQRHELASERSEPPYELGGDYHGVEAHSEEPMIQR